MYTSYPISPHTCVYHIPMLSLQLCSLHNCAHLITILACTCPTGEHNQHPQLTGLHIQSLHHPLAWPAYFTHCNHHTPCNRHTPMYISSSPDTGNVESGHQKNLLVFCSSVCSTAHERSHKDELTMSSTWYSVGLALICATDGHNCAK